MDLTKEIKLTKKLIVFLILLNIVVIGISYSYALFEVSVVKNSIVKIQTVNIIMTLTSTDLENNKTLTLNGNETKEITITITSESEINALARLYYIGDGDLTFKSDTDFKDENNIGIGEINKGESKTITIEITNNSASSVTIELGAQEGLIGYELNLNDGRNSIILEDVKLTASKEIIEKVGTDGLVAINTSGKLYSGSGTIREYRYSGVEVNNYIYFNCKDKVGNYNYSDSNYDYSNNCEIWRIVGIFNEDSEQVIKIMRNTFLTTDELPNTYVYNGTSFKIEEASRGMVYWNSNKIATNYNDWTHAGLQYFLNTESDDEGTAGYMSTLTTTAKNLIRTTKHYLGNVATGSTIDTYTRERNIASSNLHSGNQPTWNGEISLLYPSDYGYSANSSYWSTDLYSYSSEAASTSWMQQNANHSDREWLLSSYWSSTEYALLWYPPGQLSTINTYGNGSYSGARPVLHLVSSIKILKGTGESSSPYVVGCKFF